MSPQEGRGWGGSWDEERGEEGLGTQTDEVNDLVKAQEKGSEDDRLLK